VKKKENPSAALTGRFPQIYERKIPSIRHGGLATADQKVVT
jgi:hypothetical protein